MIDDYYSLVPRGISAFLLHIALGGFCYLIAWGTAQLISSVPRKVYFLRLMFMLVVILVWWTFDFHHHYNGHPRGWGIEAGNRYGMQTIWAWLALALLARPKKKQPENPAA